MITSASLANTLTDVRRRLWGVGLAFGAGWAVVCAVLFVLLWMWLDLAMELTPGLRILADVGALVLAVVVVLLVAGRNLRLGATLALAKRLDRAGGTRGQILTGADLLEGSGIRVQGSARGGLAVADDGAAVLGPGLAALAVERAAELARQVSRGLAVPVRPLFWPVGSLVLLAASVTIMSLAAPRLALTQWQRFTDPYGDHPPYSRVWFEVEPKDVQVIYGEGLEVRATPRDGVVEKVDLVLLAAGGGHEETLPMFPEPNGTWRAAVANVTAPQQYLVRSGRARSERFKIGIITVPRFEEVVFTITPPAYTRQSAYEGPLPQGGLSGLPRTRVQVRVKSNRPLAGGVVEGTGFSELSASRELSGFNELSGFRVQGSEVAVQGSEAGLADSGQRAAGFSPRGADASVNAALASPSEALPASSPPSQGGAGGGDERHGPADQSALVAMRPGPGPNEAVATFELRDKGTARIALMDVDGQKSRETFDFPITLLADERPFIRILEPERESLATPDANVPVTMDAEDDYGVARVRLFRSLNDSRPLPADVAVPQPNPARWNGTATLPLGQCGVAPGDVIKLFARVEDNDPDGAKGAESAIITIRVISQADYEQLMETRAGMEMLQAKYEMANRHLEALLDEIDKLQKEIANEPPESPLSEEQQQRLEQLAKDFAKAARDIDKAANQQLPFELDKELSPQLQELADKMQDAAEHAKGLAKKKDISVAGLESELRKLAKKTGADRQQLQEEVTAPLERMAAIYPLMEDQAMFIALYLRQRDLAERAAALKGKDSGDDPDAKARMRDLEIEQSQIREALSELLDSIEAHAAQLPEDPDLEKLRTTAQEFAAAFRDSGATDAQTAAESAMSEFQGSTAADKTKEAADIMEQFLAKCQGMEGEGSQACKAAFRPGLSACAGNTLQELLNAAGMPKIGRGSGVGAGDGYSMQRTSLQNIGLYGNLPRLRAAMESMRGGRDARVTRPGRQPGARHEADPLSASPDAAAQASGAGGVEVPVQYKQKVGRYFERIADEIGSEADQRRK